MNTQLITPNPNIPCKPGWCLEYVNNAFDVPIRYGSATAAWEGSTTQHRDRNFPAGVWHPVWYGLVNEPAGHVVLRAPNGNVYSTSDLGNTPHLHPDLADLEAYYAYYGMTLTYRGWTEDVEGTPVISLGDIGYSGTIITPSEENPLADFTAEDIRQLAAEGVLRALQTKGQFQDGRNAIDHLNQMRTEQGNTRAVVDGLPQKLLIDTRVDNRNVFDWAKYNAALTIGLGSTTGKVDVDALAAALEARLEKTDTKALLDALAARLAA